MTDRPALPSQVEQWRRNRLAINITAGLVFSGFTFVMPFLPLYVREMGVRDEAAVASWAGLLLTVAPLLAAVLAPAWGRLGDRFGMKVMVERATMAVAVHWALFGFTRGVYELLGLRILLGVFGGFGTLSMPLLVASTPREHVGRSIGTLQTVQMVAAAAGPVIGGLLADWIGIRRTCLLSAVCAAAAFFLIHRLYRDASAQASATEPSPTGRLSLRQAVALPHFGIMLILIFLVSFVERSFAPVVPLYILTLGTGMDKAARIAGLIISLGLFAEAVSATLMGRRLRRIPARRLLLWRLAGGILTCLPMGLVRHTYQFLALRVVLGLLAGGCMVIVYTLGSRVIPEQSRATSFSFLSSAALLGGALGPVCAGALTHLSIRAIFFFASFLYLVLFALSWRIAARDPDGAWADGAAAGSGPVPQA